MAHPDQTPAMIDDEERAWLGSLVPRMRAAVERIGSIAASSEHVIDMQDLHGRRLGFEL